MRPPGGGPVLGVRGGEGMSRMPPFPRTTPGRSVTPARYIHMGCRTGPGLGHPRPASVLQSPWPHFCAFLGRAQALARSPSPGGLEYAQRLQFPTLPRGAAIAPGQLPTASCGAAAGLPPPPPGSVRVPPRTQDRLTAYYRYQRYWLFKVNTKIPNFLVRELFVSIPNRLLAIHAAADTSVFKDTLHETNLMASSFYEFASHININDKKNHVKK